MEAPEAIRRAAEYFAAWRDFDLFLDDDTVEAGKQFTATLDRFHAAQDGITNEAIDALIRLAKES